MEKTTRDIPVTHTYRIKVHRVVYFWGVETVQAEDYDTALDMANDSFEPDWDNSSVNMAWEEEANDDQEAE